MPDLALHDLRLYPIQVVRLDSMTTLIQGYLVKGSDDMLKIVA